MFRFPPLPNCQIEASGTKNKTSLLGVSGSGGGSSSQSTAHNDRLLCSPFASGFANNQCGGTHIAAYVPTYDGPPKSVEPPEAKLKSISAMGAYSNKSHEELRIDDNQQGNKGGEPEFGTPSKLQLESSALIGSATASTPLFGGTNSPMWFPPISTSQTTPTFPCTNPTATTEIKVANLTAPKPTTFAVKNPFEPLGTQHFGAGFAKNQCGGTQSAAYVPTCEGPPKFVEPPEAKLISISAMGAYSNKSHEELRIEDYQQGNKGALPTPQDQSNNPKFGVDPFSSNGSHQQPTNPFRMGSSSENNSSSFGQIPKLRMRFSNRNTGSYKYGKRRPTAGVSSAFSRPTDQLEASSFWCSSEAHVNPTPPTASQGPSTGPSSSASQDKSSIGGSCTCNNHNAYAGIGSGFSTHPFGLGTASSSCFAPPFMSYTSPANTFVPFGTPVLSFPAFITYIHPGLNPFTGFVGLNGPNGAQSTAPTSVPRPANEVPSELNEPKKVPSTKPESVTNSADHQGNEEKLDDDSTIPKGLEIIVEKLGVNPWANASSGKDNRNDFPRGSRILLCEEADKDEHIIALAEFAVEQNNAMINENSRMNLTRVVGACLQAVDNGRYHIVLETKASASGSDKPRRFYVVVSQRRTERQTLTVLEKWVPGISESIEDSIKYGLCI